jgi:hypothetical protein
MKNYDIKTERVFSQLVTKQNHVRLPEPFLAFFLVALRFRMSRTTNPTTSNVRKVDLKEHLLPMQLYIQ